MSAATQWFYTDPSKQQQGPVSFEEVQRLAAEGRIQSSSLVWNEQMANWTPAGEVAGIFDAPAPGPTGSGSSNPYAAPSLPASGTAATAGNYPLPPVKRSSFGLFLACYLVGIVLTLAGVGVIVAKIATFAIEAATEMEESRPQSPATPAEIRQWEVEQERQMEKRVEEIAANPPIGAVVSMLVGYVFLIVSYILGLITLYRAWTVLQPGGARTTPGKAVGFLFIPLFNIYWIFVAYHGWAQDWNRIRETQPGFASIPAASTGLFLTTIILLLSLIILIFVPVINLLAMVAIPILFIIMFSQIYRVVNGLSDVAKSRVS